MKDILSVALPNKVFIQYQQIPASNIQIDTEKKKLSTKFCSMFNIKCKMNIWRKSKPVQLGIRPKLKVCWVHWCSDLTQTALWRNAAKQKIWSPTWLCVRPLSCLHVWKYGGSRKLNRNSKTSRNTFPL